MNKVAKWFKDNEAVIVISVVLFLIIVVVIGLLVGLGFLIDYIVKKCHENYVLENYKMVPYEYRLPVVYKKPKPLQYEIVNNEEKQLLENYRKLKRENKKIKIIVSDN